MTKVQTKVFRKKSGTKTPDPPDHFHHPVCLDWISTQFPMRGADKIPIADALRQMSVELLYPFSGYSGST